MWERTACANPSLSSLTNSTSWVHQMANNSNSAFASDSKINTALILEMPKGCVYFASWGCVYFALLKLCLFCLMRLFGSCDKLKYMVFYGWSKTGSFWWFSKVLRIMTGSDSTFANQDLTRTEKLQMCLQPCDSAGFNALYYVLFYLFLSTCVLQGVCVHTMDFVCGHKNIKK